MNCKLTIFDSHIHAHTILSYTHVTISSKTADITTTKIFRPLYKYLTQYVETGSSIPTHDQQLLEASYVMTPQHNTGFLTISSQALLHSALYGVPHKEYACHDSLQNFDVHYRTDSQPTVTTTRQTERKTDSPGDERTCGFVAADDTPE